MCDDVVFGFGVGARISLSRHIISHLIPSRHIFPMPREA